IHGENFASRLADNRVSFGGQVVVVRSATPTLLRAVVPEAARSGVFTVQVEGSTAVAQSPRFEVTAATAITGFSPQVGPPGARVVLSGTGFSERTRDNQVFLHGARARAVHATATSPAALIPPAARSGRLVVDVRNAGKAESRAEFRVPQVPALRAVTPAAATPGTELQLEGQRFGEDIRAVEVRIGGVVARVRSVSDESLRVEVPEGAASGNVEV